MSRDDRLEMGRWPCGDGWPRRPGRGEDEEEATSQMKEYEGKYVRDNKKVETCVVNRNNAQPACDNIMDNLISY